MVNTNALPAPEAPKQPELEQTDRILQRAIRNSIFLIVVFFGGLGYWMYTARLDSAAVATGVIENAANTQIIQHLEGGIVSQILVRDGQEVEQGDILLRLDPTTGEATAELYNTQLLGSQAKRVRLETEIDLGDNLVFPEDLLMAAQTSPAFQKQLNDEMRQFSLAKTTLEQNEELFRTQIEQYREEIKGLELGRSIAQRALELVEGDLKNQQSLFDRGLTNQAAVLTLLREQLDLEEKIAQAEIDIARTKQSISGLELQIRQSVETYRQTAAQDLDTVNTEIRALERDLIVSSDSLKRIEVRAPVSGTVQESILSNVGAVIGSGETIMKIAPNTADYVISAKISPNDIENILPGIEAQITFPAFASIEMAPAKGELFSVSRDRIVDSASDESYYEAEVHMLSETVPDEIKDKLVAGMTVSVILPTGERTALEYVLAPILRRWESAMREE